MKIDPVTNPLRVDLQNMRRLSFTCRWHGSISHFFSVLDHSMIGALAFLDAGEEELACAFVLHDYEEALLVGDVCPTQKKKYLNEIYHKEVAAIRARLSYTYGVNLNSGAVKAMDQVMLAVEHDTLALRVPEDSIIRAAKSLTKNWKVAETVRNVIQKHHKNSGSYMAYNAYSRYKHTMRELLEKRAGFDQLGRGTCANMPFSFPSHMK